MPHVITSLCLRDGGCQTVCPVECIVPGTPTEKWPLFYIDPETCIDCGACVSECPFSAIFPLEEVPAEYVAKGGEYLSAPAGKESFNEVYEGTDCNGDVVNLKYTRQLNKGDVIDLTPDIEANSNFFKEGPGYSALD
jgi:ferredoxin